MAYFIPFYLWVGGCSRADLGGGTREIKCKASKQEIIWYGTFQYLTVKSMNSLIDLVYICCVWLHYCRLMEWSYGETDHNPDHFGHGPVQSITWRSHDPRGNAL